MKGLASVGLADVPTHAQVLWDLHSAVKCVGELPSETSPGARPECLGFGRDPQPQREPQPRLSTTTKKMAKSGGPEDTAEADVRVRRIIVQIRSEHQECVPLVQLPRYILGTWAVCLSISRARW